MRQNWWLLKNRGSGNSRRDERKSTLRTLRRKSRFRVTHGTGE